METLVIHPNDSSTDFLSLIYRDLDCTVIRGNVSKGYLSKKIENVDSVICLGHGVPDGLLGANRRLILDSSFSPLLEKKEDCVFIWCHASDFVKRNKLTGFATGMFISEVTEAYIYNILTSQPMVYRSNYEFSNYVRESIYLDYATMTKEVKSLYKDELNPVISFNNSRLVAIEKGAELDLGAIFEYPSGPINNGYFGSLTNGGLVCQE